MENKTKKTKVDYAAIIREYEMYGRGRSKLCLHVSCHRKL